jgi:hypothetical protein
VHYTLCDYVLDIFQNAVEAGSMHTVVEWHETVSETGSTPTAVSIRDTGRGMSESGRRAALDPFTTDGIKHPGRHVGLGLPFLVQVVEATGGSLRVSSQLGEGTTVAFTVDTSHIDAPPIGDIPATLMQMFCFEGDYQVIVRRSRHRDGESGSEEGYEVARGELREALGDLETAASLSLLKEFLVQHEAVLPAAEV